MALGAARRGGGSLLDQLLDEINFQRTKEMRQLMKDGECLLTLGQRYLVGLIEKNRAT